MEKKKKKDTVEQTEINRIIDNMTLFDNDLMSLVFDKNVPATELILRIILERPVKVISVKGQVEKKNPNPDGRSITIDIEAIDVDGSHMDIEVQGNANGSHVKRARFHSSMLDMSLLKKRQNFKQIKDSYVIFIYKNDKFKKGLPVYHIDRYVYETDKPFEDGSHIIYVNGKYNGDDDIGRLMKDFHCRSVSGMYFKELKDGVRHFKETEEGREDMSDAVERYAKRYAKRRSEIVAQNTKIVSITENVKSLMSNMGWSVETAMDMLNISDSDRKLISAQLRNESIHV